MGTQEGNSSHPARGSLGYTVTQRCRGSSAGMSLDCQRDAPQRLRLGGGELAKGSANLLRPNLSLEGNRDTEWEEGEQLGRGSLGVTMF